jgi:diguanylate cyclase (GGDEF)-like protein/PAS domain S-box-containing protein
MANVPDDLQACQAEIARLNKIIQALMNRAERSTSAQGTDFSLFQTTIMLEQQVRERTHELEEALHRNEKITRDLRESEAKFRGLVSQSLVGIAIIEDGRFTYTNPKFEEIFGYGAAEIGTLIPTDLLLEHDDLDRAKQPSLRMRGRRKDGVLIDIENHSSGVLLEGKYFLVSLVLDITERVRAERRVQELKDALQEQATHDQLTGLYNRRFLEDTLQRELIRAARERRPLSMIMGDLDHFKAVNDRYGHQAGDAVLRVFGALLKAQARSSDVYCRYGGEEFLLVMPGMTEAAAGERANRLRQTVADTPIEFEGHTIRVTASFGVATFPDHGDDGDALVSAADKALYAAKAAGRNRTTAYSDLRRSTELG